MTHSRQLAHLTAAAAFAVLAGTAQGQTATRQGLTLDGAKAVAGAAAAEARRLGAGGAIAVVDDGGNLVLLERLEQTFPAASVVAIDKARTAAVFRRPTRDFENAVAKGRTALVAVEAMTPLQGGVPLLAAGQVVGAIGVSGAMSAQQDDDIATVAAAALGKAADAQGSAPATEDGVRVFPAAETSAAFAAGRPLVETSAYKIHASRREAPGQAEVHAADTDIFYVIDGAATLVTGGQVSDLAEIAPGERRGTAIAQGTARRLVKGDVIVVPRGVPHQFTEVRGPFLYYTVKVTGTPGERR
jgi:glc operon protein GlcG